MTRLSVVIPAFNESRRLPSTLAAIAEYLDESELWRSAEIIVVDDGSRDNTAGVVERLSRSCPITTTVISHSRNRGKGAAVRTGFLATTGSWLLLSDADLATPIEELEVLARAADTFTVVIGSRAVDRGLISVRQPRYRDLMGRTFNMAVRLLATPGLGDTQCGFKLFPGRVGRRLAQVQRIEGFTYDVELIAIARWWGLTVREVGVRWHHVEASRVVPTRHAAQMLRDLGRLWLWRLGRRLPPRPCGLGDDKGSEGGDEGEEVAGNESKPC